MQNFGRSSTPRGLRLAHRFKVSVILKRLLRKTHFSADRPQTARWRNARPLPQQIRSHFWAVYISFHGTTASGENAPLASADLVLGKPISAGGRSSATKSIELQTNFPFLKISYLHNFVDYRRPIFGVGDATIMLPPTIISVSLGRAD